jgi:hypothetical protein
MEEIKAIYHFIEHTYILYVSFIATTLSFLNIKSHLLSLTISNIFIYAHINKLFDYTTYFRSLLSIRNLLLSTLVSVILILITQDKLEATFFYNILLFVGMLSYKGRMNILRDTLEHTDFK